MASIALGSNAPRASATESDGTCTAAPANAAKKAAVLVLLLPEARLAAATEWTEIVGEAGPFAWLAAEDAADSSAAGAPIAKPPPARARIAPLGNAKPAARA